MDAGFQLDLDIEVEFEAELEPVLRHDVGLLAAAGVDALGRAEILLRSRAAHGDLAAPKKVVFVSTSLAASSPLESHGLDNYIARAYVTGPFMDSDGGLMRSKGCISVTSDACGLFWRGLAVSVEPLG